MQPVTPTPDLCDTSAPRHFPRYLPVLASVANAGARALVVVSALWVQFGIPDEVFCVAL